MVTFWRKFSLSIDLYCPPIFGCTVVPHELNMKLELRSLFGLHVHSCTHWLRLRNPPTPLSPDTRALLVNQDRLSNVNDTKTEVQTFRYRS
jgi:hypothetical protein